VLPISPYKALVEYTVFSKKELSADVYNRELNSYIKNVLNINDFKILEGETGSIPMSDVNSP
jgi:lycopene beta-cyclase